jgi:hypothetical protein
MSLFIAYAIMIGAWFAFILYLARRRATRDAREDNQFLRDMGAPTGLRVRRLKRGLTR